MPRKVEPDNARGKDLNGAIAWLSSFKDKKKSDEHRHALALLNYIHALQLKARTLQTIEQQIAEEVLPYAQPRTN